MGEDRRGGARRAALHGTIVGALAAASVGLNTRLDEPPRFDGAGYAMLARSLEAGRGYRQIEHPERPPHAHFPPGYPLALAGLWRLTGPSAAAAHLASAACTVGAALLAWRWFRALYPPGTALALGVALALNWSWGRVGGAIQSEPLFLLLGQLAVLAAAGVGRRGRLRAGLALGVVLGACVVTRHVGACLAAALLLELALRRRPGAALAAGLGGAAVVAPWAAWLAAIRHGTQAGLLAQGGGLDAGRVLFYVRRLPDALTGPLVEIATVFGRSRPAAAAATAWAVLATGLLLRGWARALRSPRRRVAGLVPAGTLAMLLAWPFTEAGRFLIPLVPCLLVGAVEGLAPPLAALGRRHPRRLAARLVLAAAVPYAAYAVAADRAGAQRRTHAHFDAACAWIARPGAIAGPVLTAHPAEAAWQAGRAAIAPPADGPDAVGRAIVRFGVAYLIVDDDRYADAPANPLARFVALRPGRVRRVWGRDGPRPVAVFEVAREGRARGLD